MREALGERVRRGLDDDRARALPLGLVEQRDWNASSVGADAICSPPKKPCSGPASVTNVPRVVTRASTSPAAAAIAAIIVVVVVLPFVPVTWTRNGRAHVARASFGAASALRIASYGSRPQRGRPTQTAYRARRATNPLPFEIEPYIARGASASRPSTSSITRRAATPRASRSCSYTAGRAAAPSRTSGASSTRAPTASSSSISAAAARARRTRSSKRTRRGTSSATWSGCAWSSASTSGRSSAAPGARRSRSRTPRSTPSASPSSCCAGSSCCARRRSTGSTSAAPTRSSLTRWRITSRQIPAAEHDDLLSAYYTRLTHADAETRQAAPRRRGACGKAARAASSRTKSSSRAPAGTSSRSPSLRIEAHYFVNKGFFERDTQLLDDVATIRAIPTVIVQGRYDVVCPMESAWALHRRFPEADLAIRN